MRRTIATVAFALGTLGAPALVETACSGRPVTPATVEAGVSTVNDGCTFLEGITDNRTVISVCATVEEVAWLVSTFLPLLIAGDAGACQPIQGTALCLTPLQTGRAVQAITQRRIGRFLLDAGFR